MKIPAGLTDKNIEIFYIKETDKLCMIYDSRVYEYSEWPRQIKQFLAQEMVNDRKVVKILNNWNLHSIEQMLRQFCICRYGAFDLIPDVEIGTGKTNPEIFECDKRGKCEGENIVCKNCTGLTGREIEVVRALATDIPEKQLPDVLNISIHTIRTHKKKIYKKLNVNTKVQAITKLNSIL